MSRKPPAWQAKRLLEWSKSVLIQLLVKVTMRLSSRYFTKTARLEHCLASPSSHDHGRKTIPYAIFGVDQAQTQSGSFLSRLNSTSVCFKHVIFLLFCNQNIFFQCRLLYSQALWKCMRFRSRHSFLKSFPPMFELTPIEPNVIKVLIHSTSAWLLPKSSGLNKARKVWPSHDNLMVFAIFRQSNDVLLLVHAATMEADFRKLEPVHGEYGKVFDGVGAQLGDFDVVTCFGKLQLCWGRYGIFHDKFCMFFLFLQGSSWMCLDERNVIVQHAGIHPHVYRHTHMRRQFTTCIHRSQRLTSIMWHWWGDRMGKTCMHACMHTHLHAYTPTYMHAYTPTYIHAYIHACPRELKDSSFQWNEPSFSVHALRSMQRVFWTVSQVRLQTIYMYI